MAAQAVRKDHYVGETHRFLRDGFGVYTYGNSFFKYEGEWKKGRKHGHGKFTMGDGSYYEGQFQDGEIEGYGYRFYASTGTTYTGQFHQGEPQGQGVLKYKNGTVYEGEWAAGKRSGYGTLKTPQSSTYDGFFYEHNRHGEGAQTYINGDRYDGDWVQDKRQGHGELRQADGTIYDGQWRFDMMNGQGTMIHCSGCIYEGMWFNNKPVHFPTKLVISLENSEFEADESFVIQVECRNAEDELIPEDKGRELQITAGFKWQPPKESASTKEGSALFDVIEDLEENPITTPFGYDVVSYPLTDQLPGGSMDTMAGVEELTESSEPIAEEDAGEVEDSLHVQDSSDTKEDTSVSPRLVSPATVEGSSETVIEEGTTTATAELKAREETPLPPPVMNKRTEGGKCMWDQLHLAPPPPMYRPFVMLDLESGKKSKTKSTPEKPAEKKSSESVVDEKSKSKKSTESLQFPRAGEYVIMVHDVTNPPFLGQLLEPAFASIRIKPKKKPQHKKEVKPRGGKSTKS